MSIFCTKLLRRIKLTSYSFFICFLIFHCSKSNKNALSSSCFVSSFQGANTLLFLTNLFFISMILDGFTSKRNLNQTQHTQRDFFHSNINYCCVNWKLALYLLILASNYVLIHANWQQSRQYPQFFKRVLICILDPPILQVWLTPSQIRFNLFLPERAYLFFHFPFFLSENNFFLIG